MPLSKNSFNFENGRQKGPGTDASVITRMKRQSALLANSGLFLRTAGITTKLPKKDMIDSLHTRGNEGIGVNLIVGKGYSLGFLKVQ